MTNNAFEFSVIFSACSFLFHWWTAYPVGCRPLLHIHWTRHIPLHPGETLANNDNTYPAVSGPETATNFAWNRSPNSHNSQVARTSCLLPSTDEGTEAQWHWVTCPGHKALRWLYQERPGVCLPCTPPLQVRAMPVQSRHTRISMTRYILLRTSTVLRIKGAKIDRTLEKQCSPRNNGI